MTIFDSRSEPGSFLAMAGDGQAQTRGDSQQLPQAPDWHSQYSLSAPEMRQSLSASDSHDAKRTRDPCHTNAPAHVFAGGLPQAGDKVKDKDPLLYNRIKDKVKDPTYIGQTGDVTEATHDKKGHTNGCTFIQNEPYWLAGDAAKAYSHINVDLAPKHKQIAVDRLNGAGRTLGQEEAIAWRNTGLHAQPGRSNHGFGRAIDLQDHDGPGVQPSDDADIREALHANGFRQGDHHGPLKNDLHHWSFDGPGRATEAKSWTQILRLKHHRD